jgi:hypothetical protein
MVLSLALVTQVLSRTAFKVVALALQQTVAMLRVTLNLAQVVLVVIFQHGLVSLQQLPIRVVVAVEQRSTLLTGATQHQVLLLVV